jgi:hypothetical protein
MLVAVLANAQSVRIGGSAGESMGFERENLTKLCFSTACCSGDREEQESFAGDLDRVAGDLGSVRESQELTHRRFFSFWAECH